MLRLSMTSAALLCLMTAGSAAAAKTGRCWNKDDAACEMSRNGKYPMDRQVFDHVLGRLKAAKDDDARQKAAGKELGDRYVTVMQLGRILDLFENEVIMVDVVKSVAKRVVDTKNADAIKRRFDDEKRGEEAAEAIEDSVTIGGKIDGTLDRAKKKFGVKF